METARLSLRAWRDGDVGFLTRELANFKITRNTGSIPHPYHEADALAYLRFLAHPVARSLHQAIALKHAPDTLVGGTGLYANPAKGSCEIGYWLAEVHWGQGYAKEAASAMIAHGFTVFDYPKIEAYFHNDNPASGRILQQLGFIEIENVEKLSKAQGRMVAATRTCLAKDQWLG